VIDRSARYDRKRKRQQGLPSRLHRATKIILRDAQGTRDQVRISRESAREKILAGCRRIESLAASASYKRCLSCSIYPSSQPPGQQIPISNNTGSLPDLSNVHFPSPLHTPLDQEDHSSSTPFSNVSRSPIARATTRARHCDDVLSFTFLSILLAHLSREAALVSSRFYRGSCLASFPALFDA